jgi:hypothetical protein
MVLFCWALLAVVRANVCRNVLGSQVRPVTTILLRGALRKREYPLQNWPGIDQGWTGFGNGPETGGGERKRTLDSGRGCRFYLPLLCDC